MTLDSVEDFQKKQPVRTFQCGEKALQAKKVLSNSFEGFNVGAKRDFDLLLDEAVKAPAGAETIEKLADLGVSFDFEATDACGFFNPRDNKIILNPRMSFDMNLQTLIHEGRHAIQHATDPHQLMNQNMDAATTFKYFRAMEADAVAHEIQFTHQMKDVRPSLYQESQKYAQVSRTLEVFEDEMKNSGDERKAMRATFAKWYDVYATPYDKNIGTMLVNAAEFGTKSQDKAAFGVRVKDSYIAGLCKHGNESYVTEADMNTPKALEIHPVIKKIVQMNINRYAAAVSGAYLDTSINEFKAPHEDFMNTDSARLAAIQKRAGQGR